jgi:hypothetical protein
MFAVSSRRRFAFFSNFARGFANTTLRIEVTPLSPRQRMIFIDRFPRNAFAFYYYSSRHCQEFPTGGTNPRSDFVWLPFFRY